MTAYRGPREPRRRLVRRDQFVKGSKQFSKDEFSGRISFVSRNEYIRYVAVMELPERKPRKGIGQ
ncbi:hypothetical protein OVA29_08595 [Exiguobacterium sp. SL14]|nr:hypothetical protein [Exiguobacterium sp. SL14]MCY1690713.1 hypothetical protein [Exiguobacterium sp. SL14]